LKKGRQSKKELNYRRFIIIIPDFNDVKAYVFAFYYYYLCVYEKEKLTKLLNKNADFSQSIMCPVSFNLVSLDYYLV